MSGKHEVELFISDDGELKVHIKGMKGPGCLKILEGLAKEIGEEKAKTLDSEYYETETKNASETKLKNK